jgi:hypothetical protein
MQTSSHVHNSLFSTAGSEIEVMCGRQYNRAKAELMRNCITPTKIWATIADHGRAGPT